MHVRKRGRSASSGRQLGSWLACTCKAPADPGVGCTCNPNHLQFEGYIVSILFQADQKAALLARELRDIRLAAEEAGSLTGRS